MSIAVSYDYSTTLILFVPKPIIITNHKYALSLTKTARICVCLHYDTKISLMQYKKSFYINLCSYNNEYFSTFFRNFTGVMEIIHLSTTATWMHCPTVTKNMMIIIKVNVILNNRGIGSTNIAWAGIFTVIDYLYIFWISDYCPC